MRSRWQRICLLPLIALHLLFRLRKEGSVRLEEINGPVILVANHHSYFDPFLIFCLLRKQAGLFPILPLAWRGLFFVPGLNLGLWAFGCIPVQTGKKLPLPKSLRRALTALANNQSVFIFPEARRTRDPVIRTVRRGAPFLALVTGTPLVPLAIIGTHGGIGLRALLKRPRVAVRIGTPFSFPREPQPSPERIAEAAEEIRRRIADCQTV
ncbi:MAG: hypothetical protein A2991_00610 [Candidatus Terrybacteria bacterium RIFCSPLOWO2_01_FULL_58_14]|uniref:Phospholipid/glycerol acyltransferase domain-containing protein n=1 Tax=Candidatus Terrybacteria bacterium RIFCSPLOWO2_01_FULL_58_14 TaxID=1802369 RepID=A0A1G2PWB8_9BACT|nr:MAG: hypothetical protein A2991_00610 [Candidatus Terrybacteria bacterium RIFCSPLOWO2_01_FULL_58_14]